MAGHVFIAHSTRDAPLITALQQALEAYKTILAYARDAGLAGISEQEILAQFHQP